MKRYDAYFLLWFTLSVVLLPLSVYGSHPQAGSELTPQSVDGLGTLSFPTSTRSPQAQSAFIRGMLLLHLYEYPSAATAFQEAEKIDPDFALAYWGEALTATHALWNQDNAAQGRAALNKLAATPEARAAKAGTDRERGYLLAAEKLFADGSLQQRDTDFLLAMKSLAETYPDDDEAQLFYAQALLGVTRGERHIENYLKAAEISQNVFARNPLHPGAAHYWIHGMDTPEHAAGALTAARALANIAPTAGHAQHMVSHIFLALGMWQDVAKANERAIAVVLDSAKKNGVPAVSCGHYVEWLQYSYYQLGRYRDAQGLLETCQRESRAALHWRYQQPDKTGRSPEAVERQYDGSLITLRAVAVVESPLQRSSNIRLPLATASLQRGAAWGAFARGWGYASEGDMTSARGALAHLKKFALEPPGTEESARLTDYIHVLSDLLAARVAELDGKLEEAITLANKAAQLHDSLPVEFGPPSATKPPHEYAGELLLKAARPALALDEFELALKSTPKRALSLLGQARAYTALGKKSHAKRVYQELAKMWVNADNDLPDRNELKAALR